MKPRVATLRLVLGFLVGILLLVLLVMRVDTAALLPAMQALGLWAPLLSLGLLWLTIPARALQWRIILPAGTFRGFARAQLLGYLGNVLLPLRGGEVVRILAATGARVTLEGAVVSSAIMRLQDLPVLLSLGLCSVYVNPTHFEAALLVAPLVASTALVLGLPVFAALGGWACRNASATRFPWLASSRWPARRCRALLEALPDTAAMIPSQALSLACWMLYVISPIPLFLAAGLPPWHAATTTLAFSVITSISQLVPIAPAGVGTFHAAAVAAIALTAPELSASTALAIAVLVHLIGTVGIALPGVYLLPALFSGARRSKKVEASAFFPSPQRSPDTTTHVESTAR